MGPVREDRAAPPDSGGSRGPLGALAAGDLQVVASDHSANRRERKEAGRDDFRNAPFGTPVTELLLPILFSEGVAKGRLSMERFVTLVTSGPARLFGMYPPKGTLRPGSDADILIWDPDVSWIVRADELINPSGYSLFDGWRLHGRPWPAGCAAAPPPRPCRDRTGRRRQGNRAVAESRESLR